MRLFNDADYLHNSSLNASAYLSFPTEFTVQLEQTASKTSEPNGPVTAVGYSQQDPTASFAGSGGSSSGAKLAGGSSLPIAPVANEVGLGTFTGPLASESMQVSLTAGPAPTSLAAANEIGLNQNRDINRPIKRQRTLRRQPRKDLCSLAIPVDPIQESSLSDSADPETTGLRLLAEAALGPTASNAGQLGAITPRRFTSKSAKVRLQAILSVGQPETVFDQRTESPASVDPVVLTLVALRLGVHFISGGVL